ncbi:MAG TPA: DUF1275 family protein, partial [Acetobacteraceae bacterium]|nr:DUF1275 family protein [Acetobacteraceae bacterium]
VSGAAMGVQNVAARQIEVPGVNTVVLNNTMTSIIVSLASPRRNVAKSSPPGKNVMRQSGVWACYLLGALIQGFVATHLKMGTGAFPLAAVILAVGLFYRLGRSPSMVEDEAAKAEAAKARMPPVIVMPPSRMRPVGTARTGSLLRKTAMSALPVLGAASAVLMAYRTVQRLIFGPSGGSMD